MTNLSDKIIEIFLNKQVLSLKDSYISQILNAEGISCSKEDVRRHVKVLSPSLFRLSFDTDSTMTINVDPTIDICEEFITGRCHLTVTQCPKLHICRDFDYCKIRNCRFPHNFSRGQNRTIVQRMNCENINCQLLVKLIRLKNNPSAKSVLNIKESFESNEKLSEVDDINKQIDVSYPSSRINRTIDMEIIEMNLNLKKIHIKKKFQENENEYFRRCTIQLEEKSDVDELLGSPILTYDTIDIKFKRTERFIDRKSFLLKVFNNNDQQNNIDEGRLKLYISLLIGNNNSFTLVNLSTSQDNNTFLVQCNHEFDFERIRQQYVTRKQLQGRNVVISQIYECDTISINNIDEHKMMTYNDLEKILQSAQKHVFTFQLVDQYCAEVELINNVAFKELMSITEKLMVKFQVRISSTIDEVTEESPIENVNDLMESIPLTPNKPNSITIKLRQEWALIASHPIFKLDYQDYIRTQLGGEIEIDDDNVTFIGSIPKLPRCPTEQSVLANKTNNYMQKFKYQTFRNLRPHHINILRANSNIVAFSRTQGNDYMIAARSHDLFELKDKLFPKKNQNESGRSSQMRQPDKKSSPVPLMSLNSVITPATPSAVPKTINSSICLITKPEEIIMFTINKFEDRLQKHLRETYNAEVIIERFMADEKVKGDKNRIRIKITGESENIEDASTDLTNLFLSLNSREFNSKNDGNWTKVDEAVDLIKHHFTLNDLLCTCQKISSDCIYVYYFDMTNPQFGIDSQKIEDLILNKFSLATIIDNQKSTSSKFIQEWTNLEEKLRQRHDYKKDICFYRNKDVFYFFGLAKLVKEFRQMFDKIKNQYVPQPCKINLSDKQLNFLRYGIPNTYNKLEKQYKALGCDLSLSSLENSGQFYAPVDMHYKVTDALQVLAKVSEITFQIKNNPFATLINKEPERLMSIVKSKCYLQKTVHTQQTYISVPKSRVLSSEHETARPTQTHSTSLNIGKSKITISTGDLTTQTVDVIVVCCTSDELRRSILAAAGPQVQTEYESLNNNHQHTTVTSNGALPCKQILFIPWKSDASSLKPSLSKFVTIAINTALDCGHKSLAFPSVGCGKFGFDPSLVAEYMIDEAEDHLTSNPSSVLDVSFVLISSQANVYDAFVKYLNQIKTNGTKTIRKSNTNHNLNKKYDEKIIDITLISSNMNHLDGCKNDILELANSCLFKTQLTDKQDMIDWSQDTINKYYDYCLKQDVVPTLDFNKLTLELIGQKDAVHEAEKHFYELTTETLKQARMHAVSRGIIWSVEVTPNSDTWEQYSFKLNGLIEDTYLKKAAHLDFQNDRQERCRISFSKMQEFHENDIRCIRRKVVDSLLPDTWEPSDQNCKRVVLQKSSEEYQKVIKQFDATMKNQYSIIVKIERIQNERWFKQYAAHREDFKQRYRTLDERLLFHGCLGTAANQIIAECFNRSFAGVNGVAYGCGVYFHAQASYSNSYAKPDNSGERTMFLARVLIGRTHRGTNGMKVPPTGYDTTTDGQNIFVTYHDAGAYAEYLITYK